MASIATITLILSEKKNEENFNHITVVNKQHCNIRERCNTYFRSALNGLCYMPDNSKKRRLERVEGVMEVDVTFENKLDCCKI